MAKPNNPTPEEQLLKLIENPDTKVDPAPKKPAAKAPEKPKTPAVKRPGLMEILGSFFPAKPKEVSGSDPTQTAVLEPAPAPPRIKINIKVLNNVMVALVISAAIYLALDLFVFKEDQAAFLAQVGTTDPVYPILSETALDDIQDVTYYKEPLARRNPFVPSSVQLVVEEQNTAVSLPSASKSRAPEILGSLKLVGISSGSEQPLAMIEDQDTGKTYFLKSGQEVRGVRVQSITKEKVTVTYEGQERVLF